MAEHVWLDSVTIGVDIADLLDADEAAPPQCLRDLLHDLLYLAGAAEVHTQWHTATVLVTFRGSAETPTRLQRRVARVRQHYAGRAGPPARG
jgi:hypothetical protein